MDADYYRVIARVEDRHWWFVGRRRILSSILTSLDLPVGVRILDVGCGPGGNLAMLADHGTLTAVEMDPYAREQAASRGVCEVADGSLPGQLPFSPGSFDVITALDVIEHIDDDRAALGSIRELLAPRGYLLVTVPAYQFLWSRHDEINQHRRRYTRSMLRRSLRAAGYDIVRTSYFNTLLFPIIAAARLTGRMRSGPTAGGDLRPPPPAINRVLTGLFASESGLLRHADLPFGVSLLAVARVGR
ncbi:MAG: class I SAM-dependent methyltransferase [Rhodothermales bacterium]|nr:class I SAM-dependent methyltransferase [Rhodothermales bacterium]